MYLLNFQTVNCCSLDVQRYLWEDNSLTIQRLHIGVYGLGGKIPSSLPTGGGRALVTQLDIKLGEGVTSGVGIKHILMHL